MAAFYNALPIVNTDLLGYNATTRKFAAYDANNPRTKIANFLLNFDATNGVNGPKIEDGKDRLFGDLGHDWLVGGTGNDRMFGGAGDDLMNADDNHDSQAGKNDAPDAAPFADRDYAYGGDGLDVLIANTGGDRLFDWSGEFNSFFVPFSTFGNPTVNRFVLPGVPEFLLALGAESGADRSRTEPDGELGLFKQGDPQWGSNNGSPRDPQPGITKAKQDTTGGPEDDRNTRLPLTTASTVTVTATTSAVLSAAAATGDLTGGQAQLTTDPADSTRQVLLVSRSDADDTIEVRRGSSPATLRVVINGVDKGEFDSTRLSRVIVYGNAGNDSITIHPNAGPVTAILYGGDGDDTLVGGVGDNLIDGGPGTKA